MPKLSKFEMTRQDAAGNAIVGAVLTLKPQGATVSAGGPTSFTVDSPGSIRVSGLVLGVSADGLTERSGTVGVASTSATNVTTSSGISGMVNNDRIVNSVGLLIYKDEAGNESAGASITTDANGYAFCYVQRDSIDVKSTGGTSPLGTAVDRYWFDIVPSGGFWHRTNDHPNAGTNVVRRYDCPYDNMSNGDRLIEYRTGSAFTVRWYVGLDATLTAIVPSHHVAGLLTIDSGGLTVASGTTTTQALFATTGAFSGLLTASLGLTVPASGINVTGTSTFNSSSITGVTTLTRQRTAESSINTFTNLSATPSVSGGTVFNENNGGATTITNFTSGAIGQIIHIIFFTANTTIQDNASIKLSGSANFAGTSEDTLTLIFDGVTWYEIARSVN